MLNLFSRVFVVSPSSRHHLLRCEKLHELVSWGPPLSDCDKPLGHPLVLNTKTSGKRPYLLSVGSCRSEHLIGAFSAGRADLRTSASFPLFTDRVASRYQISFEPFDTSLSDDRARGLVFLVFPPFSHLRLDSLPGRLSSAPEVVRSFLPTPRDADRLLTYGCAHACAEQPRTFRVSPPSYPALTPGLKQCARKEVSSPKLEPMPRIRPALPVGAPDAADSNHS